MTIEEFLQTLLLVLCLAACCLVLPAGLVAASAVQPGSQPDAGPGVRIVFVEVR